MMDDEREKDEQVDSAEPEGASELSDKVPDEASGEGQTPLGGTDEHSDAPGPDGTD
jgi:hypothetical protein